MSSVIHNEEDSTEAPARVRSTRQVDVAKIFEYIMADKPEEVLSILASRPRLLFTQWLGPCVYPIVHMNLLQIAVRFGASKVCTVILDMVERHKELKPMTGDMLLDRFLNTPERRRCNTLLHIASRYGYVDVLKLLLSYPQCAIKPNKHDKLPADVICEKANGERGTDEVKATIQSLLQEDCYFVPLIGSEGNVEPPYVGEPFQRRNPPDFSQPSADKLAPARALWAFAGPMPLRQAREFCQKWRKPPTLPLVAKPGALRELSCRPFGHDQAYRCSLTNELYDKGDVAQAPALVMREYRLLYYPVSMRRIGYLFADKANVGWNEYWPFLGTFVNLATMDGLRRLEQFLAEVSSTSNCSPDDGASTSRQCIAINNLDTDVYYAICHVEIDANEFPLLHGWKRNMDWLFEKYLAPAAGAAGKDDLHGQPDGNPGCSGFANI